MDPDKIIPHDMKLRSRRAALATSVCSFYAFPSLRFLVQYRVPIIPESTLGFVMPGPESEVAKKSITY